MQYAVYLDIILWHKSAQKANHVYYTLADGGMGRAQE